MAVHNTNVEFRSGKCRFVCYVTWIDPKEPLTIAYVGKLGGKSTRDTHGSEYGVQLSE
jgi:hypothetical protein